MSGIITVQVIEGNYKCIDCLKDALNELNLINSVQIKFLEDKSTYTLKMAEQIYDLYANSKRNELTDQLHNFNQQILPLYTEKHAIHSFKNRGFIKKKTYFQTNSHKMIFEKTVGVGTNQQIYRYEITVIPSEGRILIDGGEMPGMKCRQYSSKFQKDMGKFVSFQSSQHEKTAKIQNRHQTRNKISRR